MQSVIYIFSSGKIKRKNNTIVLITKEGEKKTFPINAISDIMVFGEVVLNKRLLEFLTKKKVCLHFFNRYGWYVGSYYPRFSLNSSFITVKQVEFYLDKGKRLDLARRFVFGAYQNSIKNLEYYYKTKKDDRIGEVIQDISTKFSMIDNVEDIPYLMSLEGYIKKRYYGCFNFIFFNNDFSFESRVKRPPNTPVNALISFGNSLIYATCLSEIYRTYLDPRVGYLHQSNNRSFSLNLDLAEVFKPIIVDRTIFSLINKREISDRDFHKVGEGIFLKESGKKKFISRYEEKLQTTIKYKNIGNVSYRKLIRMECYKLYKHFIGESDYKPFISEW